MPHHAGPCREAPGSFRRQKELGESKARAEPLLWFLQEGKDKAV